jgi:hypothetical protein
MVADDMQRRDQQGKVLSITTCRVESPHPGLPRVGEACGARSRRPVGAAVAAGLHVHAQATPDVVAGLAGRQRPAHRVACTI